MPNQTPDRKSGNRRAFTRDQYETMLNYFRVRPGDIQGAAEAAGVDPRTAQKTWSGPPRKLYPWAVPIGPLLREEETARMAAAAEEEARRLAAEQTRAAEAAKLEDEKKRLDRDILRLARADVLQGLGSLGELSKGITQLIKRTVEQITRGTDSTGKAIDVKPADVLLMVNRYSSSVARLADAAASIVAVEEIHKQLPPMVQVNIHGPNATLEDAQAELASAQEALARAQRLQLMGREIVVQADEPEDAVAQPA